MVGYEGAYEVSDQGRVRSLDRYVRAKSKAGRWYMRLVKGVNLAPGFSRGYPIVNVGGQGTIAVHLLVGRAWLPPQPTPLHEVNHKNGIKKDCRVVNLEWVTRSNNILHAVRTGLFSQAIPVTDGSAIWPSQAQAAFEICGDRRRGTSISRVIRGERYTAFGRGWWAV